MTQGEGELLMMALPHHMDTLTNQQITEHRHKNAEKHLKTYDNVLKMINFMFQ